ncbi:conserved protein of unknown function [Rhodovastum atsumiense]|uniref:Uncharacterized protein n=1 Tax=Rhodovastum atsumiense TaxID=504468 RepID=A0A5M6IM03_9PROT|nr:hypothetical protein [Rhodovastum atsumiense]KAA5609242.1 hypothetical protein F1189_25020 [Rhodovastum atsumiense]CAH2601693.1 conserved protein of unknown function [Rhodovastum atsumiense]
MQAEDGLRRGGYVIAFALTLIAIFVFSAGNFWAGCGLVLAAMAVISGVEHLAELEVRDFGFARLPAPALRR